jgi:hypothetical protein
MVMGAVRGAAHAAVVGVWLLARGANDWLQAPYGFDIYCLITLAAAVALYQGADPQRKKQVAQT